MEILVSALLLKTSRPSANNSSNEIGSLGSQEKKEEKKTVQKSDIFFLLSSKEGSFFSMSYYDYTSGQERWQSLVPAQELWTQLSSQYDAMRGLEGKRTGAQVLFAAFDGLFRNIEQTSRHIFVTLLIGQPDVIATAETFQQALWELKLRVLFGICTAIKAPGPSFGDNVVARNLGLKVLVNFCIQEVIVPGLAKFLQIYSQKAFDRSLSQLRDSRAPNIPTNPTGESHPFFLLLVCLVAFLLVVTILFLSALSLLKKLIPEKFWSEQDFTSLKTLALDFGKVSVESALATMKLQKTEELGFHLNNKKVNLEIHRWACGGSLPSSPARVHLISMLSDLGQRIQGSFSTLSQFDNEFKILESQVSKTLKDHPDTTSSFQNFVFRVQGRCDTFSTTLDWGKTAFGMAFFVIENDNTRETHKSFNTQQPPKPTSS